jgi:hypothetical protein
LRAILIAPLHNKVKWLFVWSLSGSIFLFERDLFGKSVPLSPRNTPAKSIKKTAGGLNVRRGSRDQYRWERKSLPIEAVFGASAHPPQAPI